MARSVTTATATAQLADRLVALCVEQLEELATRYAPGLLLPRQFAGHAVDADARADLIFTLGYLGAADVPEVAGASPDEHVRTLLGRVDGRATHTFFSYRIAETVLRAGPFADNALLRELSEDQRAEVARACDTSDWIPLLDSGLPRNYAGVLARCELARWQLGLLDDRRQLDELLDRLRTLLDENPNRYLDDSNDGSGRYDIYTADVWLFCEPLGAELGSLWDEGIGTALALVDAVGCRDGSAVPWGRSTGVLAVALTVELAALALAQDRAGERAARWLRRGFDATRSLERSFAGGLSTAHQHRDQDSYRGPARRLQLTLDVLGKAAYAAALLRQSPALAASLEPAAVREAYPARDELIHFDRRSAAAVWTMRSRASTFVMPFVGAARSHYLPALHDPGRFEVPVDADLPCWAPLIVDGLGRYTTGTVPRKVEHGRGQVRVEWGDFTPTAPIGKTVPDPLAGRRALSMRVEGRSVLVDDELRFANVPDSIDVVIPATASLPLTVEATSDPPGRVTSIDVAGLAEWRSSWSELAVAHQVELEPAEVVRYSMRVTPKLRVASTAFGHHYHECLYDPLADRVVTRPSPFGFVGDASVDLADVEVFHLHWPEWVMFDDLDAHRRVIGELRDRDVPIVWTAHNLTPHDRRPDVYDPIYEAWAQAASAVIHHSRWGEARMRERYDFSAECRHRVIPHGHWGPVWDAYRLDRAEAEARLGLEPTPLRVGLVGAPRADKRVVEFLDGVACAKRADVQVVCWSLLPGETAPYDARIAVAKPYHNVDRATYAAYLSACDVIALPFVPECDMLATGTAFDAIAFGLPALATVWPYLGEVLGPAGIPIGVAPTEVAEALDALDESTLRVARVAAVECRAATEWQPIAEQTLALFEELFDEATT